MPGALMGGMAPAGVAAPWVGYDSGRGGSMELERSAGVLLHPTCLPSRFGIGDLGPAADVYVEWLAGAGVSWWQVLPLNPPNRCLASCYSRYIRSTPRPGGWINSLFAPAAVHVTDHRCLERHGGTA